MNIQTLQNLISQKAARIRQRMKANSLANALADEIKSARKYDRVVSAVMEFWREEGVPGLEAITEARYQGGVLTVRIPSAAHRFVFDRHVTAPDFFRATAERAPGTLSSIRTKA